MTEYAPHLDDGFSPANISRIYHGLPALSVGRTPEEALTAKQYAVAEAAADGLTYIEVAETLEMRRGVVRTNLQAVHDKLGLRDSTQLAGFFPMEADYGAIGDKKLGDLTELPSALNILEAIAVGKRNSQVAKAVGASTRTVREQVDRINQVWEDIEGPLMTVRVANAIRARYVQAIEDQPGSIEPRHIPMLTLPALAKLEPRIENEFLPPVSEPLEELAA